MLGEPAQQWVETGPAEYLMHPEKHEKCYCTFCRYDFIGEVAVRPITAPTAVSATTSKRRSRTSARRSDMQTQPRRSASTARSRPQSARGCARSRLTRKPLAPLASVR